MSHANTVHEQVSALADGQLRANEFADLMDKVSVDPEIESTWQTYQMIGDVLRTSGHVTCSDSSAFLARFQNRLLAEPSLSASLTVHAEPKPLLRRTEAANDPIFRWKLVAGAASFVAAAAIGWSWIGMADSSLTGAQVAQGPVTSGLVTVTQLQGAAVPGLVSARLQIGDGHPQRMLSDPRLDQLIEAHQQAGGASKIPSGFLRNATFERPLR